MEIPVTMVRLYLPEASHSTHKAQMEKVMHLLCDQLHVHGLSISSGLPEAGTPQAQHFESVSDVLKKKPDPPTIVEFFDESPAAAQIRRKLCQLAPNSYAVSWQATWETSASRGGAVRATMADGA